MKNTTICYNLYVGLFDKVKCIQNHINKVEINVSIFIQIKFYLEVKFFFWNSKYDKFNKLKKKNPDNCSQRKKLSELLNENALS